MAIGAGSLIEIVMNMNCQGQQTINAYQYEVGNYPGTVTPVQLAEAWWNHVKVAYRATVYSTFTDAFRTVRVREMNNPLGDYAEYDVPVAEQPGTRSATGMGEVLPPFLSVGVRLVVGTRVTRPGQKRFAFLAELDNVSGNLNSASRTLFVSLLNVMTVDMLLGAPAATVELSPRVTRRDAQGFVVASQPITGYLINNQLTSQNTRKVGRGA